MTLISVLSPYPCVICQLALFRLGIEYHQSLVQVEAPRFSKQFCHAWLLNRMPNAMARRVHLTIREKCSKSCPGIHDRSCKQFMSIIRFLFCDSLHFDIWMIAQSLVHCFTYFMLTYLSCICHPCMHVVFLKFWASEWCVLYFLRDMLTAAFLSCLTHLHKWIIVTLWSKIMNWISILPGKVLRENISKELFKICQRLHTTRTCNILVIVFWIFFCTSHLK